MNSKHSWDERKSALNDLKRRGWSLREIAKDLGVKERSLATAVRRGSTRGKIVPMLDDWLERRGYLSTPWDQIENPEDWINRHCFIELGGIAGHFREVEMYQACLEYHQQLEQIFKAYDELHTKITALEAQSKKRSSSRNGESGG